VLALQTAPPDLVSDEVRDHDLPQVAQMDRPRRTDPGGADQRRIGPSAFALGDDLVRCCDHPIALLHASHLEPPGESVSYDKEDRAPQGQELAQMPLRQLHARHLPLIIRSLAEVRARIASDGSATWLRSRSPTSRSPRSTCRLDQALTVACDLLRAEVHTATVQGCLRNQQLGYAYLQRCDAIPAPPVVDVYDIHGGVCTGVSEGTRRAGRTELVFESTQPGRQTLTVSTPCSEPPRGSARWKPQPASRQRCPGRVCWPR